MKYKYQNKILSELKLVPSEERIGCGGGKESSIFLIKIKVNNKNIVSIILNTEELLQVVFCILLNKLFFIFIFNF